MLSLLYNPKNWYWLASDGRVYASARQAVVTTTDAAYVAWLAAGFRATLWPSDNSGAQTTRSLQDVLDPYGLFVDLATYAANARFNKETGGITVSGIAVPTDRLTQAQLTGAYNYVQVTPSASIQWKLANGSFVTLTAAQITAIATAVAAHVQACFAAEATLDAGIAASPPTVTTFAQIDAAFA